MNIILTTMIKNEEKTITRMLKSCLGVATHYCVVDTGSTDNTVKVVEQWFHDNAVEGVLANITFQDFGSSRTQTLREAQAYAKQLELDLNDTYLLLLDADMILENHGFNPTDLSQDVIRLAQRNGTLVYQNVRLVRASLDVCYIGRTHEYVSVSGKFTQIDYGNLVINDVGDGGCKSDKFIRDERLLKLDLKENPNNERSLYYLGSTCEALGKYKDAIKYFTRRMNAGGFEEEAWMAGFRRGVVHMAMKQTKDAEEDFLNCWARRPWRAEPLRHLAQIYLDTNRQTHACAIAKAALNIPYPKHDLLFIEHPCYHDEFHRILSIGAFYAGRQYDGAGHSDALILRKGASHKQNALQNASWYMERLPVKRTVNLGDMVELKEGWHACNPSIIRPFIGSSGYHASIRTVNYTINPDGSYNYPGYVATETYWVELDGDLNKVKPAIKLQNPRSEQPNALIRGVEDVRFYAYSNTEIIALGVRADGEEARPQLFHCNWDNTGKLTLCERASAPGRTEKNWLPFIEGGVSKAIYTTGPDLTIVPIGKTGDTLTSPSCIDARDFRGGGGPIKFYGGCLWTVHQVTVRSGMSRRTYLHRFVWVPENWDASKMRCSRPFCFQDQTIEFCSGLARGDNECLLAYGVLDNTAHLAVVDDQVILNMLGLGGRA